MANKLGRGLNALFGNCPNVDDVINLDVKKNAPTDRKLVAEAVQPLTKIDIEGTPIVPTRNEEAVEIEKHIESVIHLPTSLRITKKGGKVIIKCRTYEELEVLVKKLTADE